MKMIRLLAVAAAVFVVSGAGAQAPEFPKPTAEHERLRQMAGTWDAAVKCHFMQQEGKGEYRAAIDLGGFFLVTEFKGELAGKPFQGRGLTGYDPFKKKYVGTWVDSMSPGIYNAEGAFDPSGKVFTETLEGPCPEGKPMRMRAVTQIKGNDHMHFQMHMRGDDGKETLMMEIAYTRKK
jgi:hypothetical protein